MDLDRRTVLQATGMLATAGVLAACGSSEEPAAEPSGAAPADTPDAGPADPDMGDAQAPESTAVASGAMAVSDIPVGGGVILAEPAIVVTQPTEGDVKAFTAICPHQGCLVAEVKDNVIICPCHDSLFSAVDGSVLQGPAQTGLSSAGVAVDGGAVVIS